MKQRIRGLVSESKIIFLSIEPLLKSLKDRWGCMGLHVKNRCCSRRSRLSCQASSSSAMDSCAHWNCPIKIPRDSELCRQFCSGQSTNATAQYWGARSIWNCDSDSDEEPNPRKSSATLRVNHASRVLTHRRTPGDLSTRSTLTNKRVARYLTS